MSNNSEVLDAVNRAIDALTDLRTLLEQEAAAPAEPEQTEPKAATPELVLPEPETKQPEPFVHPDRTDRGHDPDGDAHRYHGPLLHTNFPQ